jgi:hypothetical protein
MTLSAERLAETFKVSPFTANLALLVLRGRVDPLAHPKRFPRTVDWVNRCCHAPRTAEVKLAALDETLETYGVEGLAVEGAWIDRYHGDIVASYLNTGDTYSPTLLLDHDANRWRLTSWGDFYESVENRYSGESDDG